MTTAPYTNASWTITGNHFAAGYYGEPYRGGTTVAGQLYNISDLQMTGNTFPLCAWTYEEPQPASACAAPDEYVFDFDVITGGTIENNNFAGALGIAKPQLYDQYLTDMTECGNTYGLNAAQLDGSCPSTQLTGGSAPAWFRVPRHPARQLVDGSAGPKIPAGRPVNKAKQPLRPLSPHHAPLRWPSSAGVADRLHRPFARSYAVPSIQAANCSQVAARG